MSNPSRVVRLTEKPNAFIDEVQAASASDAAGKLLGVDCRHPTPLSRHTVTTVTVADPGFITAAYMCGCFGAGRRRLARGSPI